VPFLRRRQEDEPDTPAPSAAAAAPEPAVAARTTEPYVPPLSEPLPPPEAPVESQFQLVEGADEMLDMPLGTLIFRAGLIAPQQLEDALAEGLRSGKRLGEVLLSRGWLSENDLSRLLAGQKGLPYADLEKIAVERELAQAMSYDGARAEMALPVVTEFGLPVVAMADPDEAAMERLRTQLGPEVRFVVGAPSVLARLIDEVLGGAAPASGLLVAPTASERYPSTEPSAAGQGALGEILPVEAAPPETAAEPEPVLPEPVLPEPVALEAVDQVSDAPAPEVPSDAPEPDPAAQEMHPIIVEGEIDYPTFSAYEPIPETEMIGGPDEQLPAEVQTGEFGYYGDTSLLEGNAWQAEDAGPGAAEPAVELGDPSAGQYEVAQPAEDLAQPIEEPTQPAEDFAQPIEEAAQPTEPTEAPIGDVESPVDYAEQPIEYAEQPIEYAEQPIEATPVEQAWEEPSPAEAPEPVASAPEEPALELPDDFGPAAEEESSVLAPPAWMRGEVNLITADVADFIESGNSDSPDSSFPPEVEPAADAESQPEPAADAESQPEPAADAESQPEPAVGEYETPAEPMPPLEDVVGPEAAEPAPSEPAAGEFVIEPPSWASEPVEATEEVAVEAAADIPLEPAPASKETAAPQTGGGEFELVLRLVDGDKMPIGSFGTVEAAQEKAAEVVKQFAEISEGGWPFIGGRFLRPETIVSIDVEQHGSGWGGSNARGRMFSGNDGP
jgi:hypothetical protein